MIVVVPLSDLRFGFRNRLDFDGWRVIRGSVHRLSLLKVQVGVHQLVLLPARSSLLGFRVTGCSYGALLTRPL